MTQNKFYKAWKYLENCDYFKIKIGKDKENYFGSGCLDISVVKVNPKTLSIDDDEKKNTLIQVWIETGGWEYEYSTWCHDIKLDCGGDSFDEAIIKLAKLVKKYYK